MSRARRLPMIALCAVCTALALGASAACTRAGTVATPPPAAAPSLQTSMASSAEDTTDSQPSRERLETVGTWAFAIGDGALDGTPEEIARRLGRFDLVVVDGESATTGQVERLRERGTIVLAYLSVGTIEPWRSWYPDLKPYALETWEDWDEYYADLAAPGFRTAIGRIADGMLDKGFDGLFLDNVDMVETHPSAEPGMTMLVGELSRMTRARGGLLFAQNGEGYELGLAPLLDGWNREDVTFTYDFDTGSYVSTPAEDHAAALAAIAAMKDAGLFVTTTDYLPSPGGPQQAEAERVARAAGALPFTSDIELTRLP